jgi:hypothetical protein
LLAIGRDPDQERRIGRQRQAEGPNPDQTEAQLDPRLPADDAGGEVVPPRHPELRRDVEGLGEGDDPRQLGGRPAHGDARRLSVLGDTQRVPAHQRGERAGGARCCGREGDGGEEQAAEEG